MSQVMNNLTEKCCLKWHDFQENISTTFSSLREDTDFADVTLACDDGRQVEAHKIILAASSAFFQNLLRENKHAHPLIYMRGMKSEGLVAIVDFLYHGEVNIYQQNVEDFLVIAKELKINGLTGVESDWKQNNKILKANEKLDLVRVIKTEAIQDHEHDQTTQDFTHIDYLQKWDKPETTLVLLKEPAGDSQELDEKIKSMILLDKKDGERIYTCQVCGKENKYHSNMRNHIETHHIKGVSFPCNLCSKTFR